LVAAIGVVATHTGELQDGIRAQWTTTSLVWVWLLYAGIVILHELAHGYVCAHFGGRVNALGILFLYGRPCAYCDVSDRGCSANRSACGSWLRAVRSSWFCGQRRRSSGESRRPRRSCTRRAPHHGICGVGTLLNFNPLIQFDGYYMLSDGLEIPNLRSALSRIGTPAWRGGRGRSRPTRTARVSWYGPVAIVYTGLMASWIVCGCTRGSLVAGAWSGSSCCGER
jgi:putative peptide zinc metalloprotease protein